jgi:hypothetical protein
MSANCRTCGFYVERDAESEGPAGAELETILLMVCGFAAGYAVRETISRRRRAKWRERVHSTWRY